jgi:YD repeat-containing protein
MKVLIVLALLIICGGTLTAQYYYKDILLGRQATDKWKAYHQNKVKSVKILSFEANNQPIEGFTCEQNISADFSEISTHTRSSLTNESYFISYYDENGLLKKTIDTSDRFQSTTEYEYDSKKQIVSITNTSMAAAGNNLQDIETHQWQYDETGKPMSMLKIKNNNDTTYISFIKDEKGNIAEEHSIRNKQKLPAIYYYYDEEKRITDIVRYNNKAQRLLPDFIFEYANNGLMVSMLTVPEDTGGYQKWIYEYDDKGLRWKESCFSKQKQLLGKIEYEYNFKK